MSKIVLPVGGGQTGAPGGAGNNLPNLTELKIGNDTFKVNDKGEAVDDTGKVVKTKDELEALKTAGASGGSGKSAEELEKEKKLAERTTQINSQLVEGTELEIDGVNYKLNKDGAIEKDGKVFKTKDELRTLLLANTEEPGDIDYVTEIQKITNISPITPDGKPVTYENTLQGLAQREQDVFIEGRKLGGEEFKTKLFEQYPILADVIDHLTIHGSLKDFNESVDYSKIIIGDDENQQIAIYTKAQLQRGIPQQEITEMVNYLKADKKLKTASESALTYLKAEQTNLVTTRAAEAKRIKDAQDAEENAYWDTVNKTITYKELIVGDKKFKLPEVIKVKEADGKIVNRSLKDFQDYITKPLNFRIDNKIYTMTQLQYDTLQEDTKRTPHNDIFDAYRKFTKYDDSQLIAAQSNDNTVKNIIKLKTKAGSGGSGTSTSTGKLKLPIN